VPRNLHRTRSLIAEIHFAKKFLPRGKLKNFDVDNEFLNAFLIVF